MTLAENQYNLDGANQISCGKGNILRRLVGLTRLHTDRQLLSLFKVSRAQPRRTGCIHGHMAPWGLRLCPPVALHTAPERCQPEKFATLSFSAFLVVCDQDKKLQIGQQIL